MTKFEEFKKKIEAFYAQKARDEGGPLDEGLQDSRDLTKQIICDFAERVEKGMSIRDGLFSFMFAARVVGRSAKIPNGILLNMFATTLHAEKGGKERKDLDEITENALDAIDKFVNKVDHEIVADAAKSFLLMGAVNDRVMEEEPIATMLMDVAILAKHKKQMHYPDGKMREMLEHFIPGIISGVSKDNNQGGSNG